MAVYGKHVSSVWALWRQPSTPPRMAHHAHTGFAEGLSRPVTLIVGDISFLHDVNGLNLLRTREARPPLTVVLVNNKGGGIFSFLPIAGEVSAEQFSSLWATPQNVDLEGEAGRMEGNFTETGFRIYQRV